MDITVATRIVTQLATELKDMDFTLTPYIGSGCYDCSRIDPFQFCIYFQGWPRISAYEEVHPQSQGQCAWIDMIPTNEGYDQYFHIFFGEMPLTGRPWTANEMQPAKRAAIRSEFLQQLDQHLKASQQLFRVEVAGGIEISAQHLLKYWKWIDTEVLKNNPTRTEPSTIITWSPSLVAVNKNGSVNICCAASELGYLVPKKALHKIVATLG